MAIVELLFVGVTVLSFVAIGPVALREFSFRESFRHAEYKEQIKAVAAISPLQTPYL